MTLPPNLQLWLNGGDGVHLASGTNVADWNDKSGKGHSFSRGGATYPQQLEASNLLLANGNRAKYVRLGTDEGRFMYSWGSGGPAEPEPIDWPGQVTDAGITYNVAYEVYAVCAMADMTSINSSLCICAFGETGNSPLEIKLYMTGGASPMYKSAGACPVIGGPNPAAPAFKVIHGTYYKSGYKLRGRGGAWSSSSAAIIDDMHFGFIGAIGYVVGSSRCIADLRVYNKVGGPHSSAEVQAVYDDLAAFYPGGSEGGANLFT